MTLKSFYVLLNKHFVLTLVHEYVVETNDGISPLSDSMLKDRGPALISNLKTKASKISLEKKRVLDVTILKKKARERSAARSST